MADADTPPAGWDGGEAHAHDAVSGVQGAPAEGTTSALEANPRPKGTRLPRATAASVPSAFLSLARVSVATCNHEPAQRPAHRGRAGKTHSRGAAWRGWREAQLRAPHTELPPAACVAQRGTAGHTRPAAAQVGTIVPAPQAGGASQRSHDPASSWRGGAFARWPFERASRESAPWF